MASSKGRHARQKGKRGERMLATELRTAFPEFADKIRRGWQVREGDDDPDVLGVPGFWWESKFLARFNSSPLTQAIGDAKGRGIPVAVVRTNRKEPIALIRWVDLLMILQVYVRNVKGAEDERRGRPVQSVGGDPKVRKGSRQQNVHEGRRWRVPRS